MHKINLLDRTKNSSNINFLYFINFLKLGKKPLNSAPNHF